MYLYTRLLLLVVTAALVLGGGEPWSVLGAEEQTMSDDVWSRTHRVFAYDAPWRARYPSLARGGSGTLVLLFTQVSKEQEEAGLGDVMMIQSADKGASWSAPIKIYEGKVGEPRTMGSLAKLTSGRLMAAVTEMDKQGKPQQVRMLVSGDGGRNWTSSVTLEFSGVNRAAPYGRLIEAQNGVLLMAIETQRDDGSTQVGLMRSKDQGQSWGDFSLIASAPEKQFSRPTVLANGPKSLLAIIEHGEALYRCRSEDSGYHWTSPQQVLVGRQPHVTSITDQLLACVAARGPSNYGTMSVTFSYDEAKTWRCERTIMAYRAATAHWGWPSALALDVDNLLVAISRTQLPSPSVDGPASRPVSVEQERIEVVFFERDQQSANLPLPERVIRPEARDRWEPAGGFSNRNWSFNACRLQNGDLLNVQEEGDSLLKVWAGPGNGGASAEKYVSAPTPTPKTVRRSSDHGQTWTNHPMTGTENLRGSPGLLTQLSSGRLLCTITEWLLVEWNYETHKVVGQKGGYTIWNPDQQAFYKRRLTVLFSDDEGKTWQGAGRALDTEPYHWAIPNARFIERNDGTVVMPVFGCVTVEDGFERLDSCGLYRSTDGGESWGDFSEIAYDKQDRNIAYNEMDIAVIRDDLWVAFIRTEPRRYGSFHSWMSRALSTDGGYTWTQPELCFTHSVPAVEILPDGGIAVGASGGLHLTYDLGRTWTREIPVSGYAIPILLDNDTLLVGNGQSQGSFARYRRIAAGHGPTP